MPPWEYLLKKILWTQLGEIKGKRILDFGSGTGITADHYAKDNEVVAVEPSAEAIAQRSDENAYQQFLGSTDILRSFPNASFDIILCHNVLEYADDRENIVQEFHRLLKPDGLVSIVKHNPAGRVMQMVVLLNEFERAKSILDGENDTAVNYGAIRYYGDSDLTKWCSGFSVAQVSGIRTFWDLQQNQECHKDPAWQEKMIDMELRGAQIEEFQNIAFFHHIILNKEKRIATPACALVRNDRGFITLCVVFECSIIQLPGGVMTPPYKSIFISSRSDTAIFNCPLSIINL